MSDTNQQQDFRASVREWLAENFPPVLAGMAMGMEGETRSSPVKDLKLWRSRLAEQGWGAPTWPVEYGGAGLSHPQARIIADEMAQIGATNPIPMLAGMGVTMVGPTILEYGTDDQKQRHLPGIASGEVRWCLGLSEPNAGSDLASLTTKAEADGDNFVLNGQKVWTSGADISQWCGALVRTDSNAGKRDGISFVMLPMDQPGVETRPIKLIAGASPFCETYFNNAIAEKNDLLGELNDGWSVIKRLLQHERQSQTSARGGGGEKAAGLSDLAKTYVGTLEDGTLADADLRFRLASHLMDAQAHSLTIGRITAEAKGKVEVTAAASILKNSATRVAQIKAELTVELMGHQGLGWEGETFSNHELGAVREWLGGKAISIYGGSFEVQNNIISKNILGLPETTQKG
ncbi:MAG: acyl-CoA dehydrogenase family protein [Proteobacteria bacterium]|nr:acyl-CoA dehydrogenase family protein [Pseudomonadota bacterium]